MHLVKTHNNVHSESDSRLRHRYRNPEKETERRYFCPFEGCRYNDGEHYFKAFKLLRQHFMKVHEKKELCCDKCGSAKFSLLRDLRYHQKRSCPQRDFSSAEPSTSVAAERNLVRKRKHSKEERPPKSATETRVARQRTKANVTKVYIIRPQGIMSSKAHFVPILPKGGSRSVSSQTTPDLLAFLNRSLVQPTGSSNVEVRYKNAATNVAFTDLPPVVDCQISLPPIGSIAFQPQQTYEQTDFYCQTSFSFADELRAVNSSAEVVAYQDYACGVSQNDCAVQSTTIGGPETRHVETQMDDFDFEEIWRHIETQTSESFGNDVLTQTVNDLMDSGSMTDGPYHPWSYSLPD